MEKFEIVKAKEDFLKRLDAVKKVIDYDNIQDKIKKLETLMVADDF
jgi:peptidoglycan hydrolase CwlO-like protein